MNPAEAEHGSYWDYYRDRTSAPPALSARWRSGTGPGRPAPTPVPDLWSVGRPETLEGRVRAFLGAKRVTLWCDWDLTNPKSFEQAVAFLTKTVAAVMA